VKKIIMLVRNLIALFLFFISLGILSAIGEQGSFFVFLMFLIVFYPALLLFTKTSHFAKLIYKSPKEALGVLKNLPKEALGVLKNLPSMIISKEEISEMKEGFSEMKEGLKELKEELKNDDEEDNEVGDSPKESLEDLFKNSYPNLPNQLKEINIDNFESLKEKVQNEKDMFSKLFNYEAIDNEKIKLIISNEIKVINNHYKNQKSVEIKIYNIIALGIPIIFIIISAIMLFSGNDWWFYDATVGKVASYWYISPGVFIWMVIEKRKYQEKISLMYIIGYLFLIFILLNAVYLVPRYGTNPFSY